MAIKRKAAGEPELQTNGNVKRRHISDREIQKSFRTDLFEDQSKRAHRVQYEESKPYKHGVIRDLLDPTLIRNVRDEIQTNLSFTPKETDIYKIHQSGDLANLDGLEENALNLLPSLVKLRDALYSPPFRSFLSQITGAGSLSGSKTDMAVNIYTPTCHLLCHDDVIGSRKVSYILYLTDPDRPWKAEWGGALRLYPTEKMQEADGSEMRVPSADFSVVIPPAFNQLSFFAVQPGESFHDVEEVYTGQGALESEDDGGRVRMAISGWYHIPQPGEDGFEQGAQEKQAARSSLAQLQGKADKYDLPQPCWARHDGPILASGDDKETELNEEDLNFLLDFMNPRYLTPDTVEELAENFSEESTLQLGLFLAEKYAKSLRESLSLQDKVSSRNSQWNVSRPPHKHRFMYCQPDPKASNASMQGLEALVNILFPSLAFRKWLSLATGLTLGDNNILARRFRRGLDYTLATGYEEDEPQLEVCLCITPSTGWTGDDNEGEDEVDGHSTKAESARIGKRTANGGAGADVVEGVRSETATGGYEVYMAGDEDDEDADGSDHGVNIPSSHTGAGNRREKADPAIYKASGEEDDDGILFTTPSTWNTLSVVLRDKGTLKFVKYISKSAPGDRWDIVGDFKVEDADEDNV